MRHLLALGATALLTGCGTPSLDIDGRATAAVKKKLENQFGQSTMTIRTFTQRGDETVEVAGAVCQAKNSLVSFSGVKTPAVVTLPTYMQAERFADRGKPEALRGSCTLGSQTWPFVLEASSAAGNVTTSQGATYDPNTGLYSNPTSTRLTSRLSSTLPWSYRYLELGKAQ